MLKLLCLLGVSATATLAQYKMEPAGPPPSGLPPAVAGALQQTGTRILGADGSAVCEIWFRNAVPAGEGFAEPAVSFPTVPKGALLGAISYPVNGADRRGQTLKPGLYTLRYHLYPVDGAHQGVAPQRDFLVLSLAASDSDPNSLPSYDELMHMSQKASGTPHPAVLSIQTPLGESKIPSLTQEGESDWVLNTRVGGLSMSVILIGVAQG